MLIYRRNGGSLPVATIVTIVWDVATDIAQFFYTLPTEEEFIFTPQKGIPHSNLAVWHSFLSANVHVSTLHTPKQ